MELVSNCERRFCEVFGKGVVVSNNNILLVNSAIPPESNPLTDELSVVGQCRAIWRQFGLRIPRVVLFPDTVVPHSRDLREVFDVVDEHDVDAILLTNERQLFALERFRCTRNMFLVPAVNVSGKLSPAADVDFDLTKPQSWTDTADCISRFADRRRRLPSRFHSPTSPAIRMLAYLFVSGSDLTPVPHPASPLYFAYKGFANTRTTVAVAEALADRGWLERSFFDRYHECAGCRSHRLAVREECPVCRSPNLSETSLIHHYGCAQLSPEGQFRQGSALVCPKCSKQLRHYGKDYDKPGIVQICGHCKSTTSEPAVGFVCQDCRVHVDGDVVNTADVFTYTLSDQAVALLATDHAENNHIPSRLLRHLPEKLQREVLQLSVGTNVLSDFVVAEVQYEARDQLLCSKGEAAFASMRKLFLDNLQGFLGERATVHKSHDSDYVLFLDLHDSTLGAPPQTILDHCDAILSERLHPRLLTLWSGSKEVGGE
ncbi:hypothetical protein [Chelativorans salis]|uniref:Thaumarchaeal output domain-containing protein n=1 Tax=Chelativorans salis TaxID=2978478 RepID=A0ABT2LUZ1_9HYPH|nr:hypothetical protein [Chelativorans sp. EGI FJ00035]MCT7378345.1 hypothetical protein [Chelativorans sp. EGI FJ00035]